MISLLFFFELRTFNISSIELLESLIIIFLFINDELSLIILLNFPPLSKYLLISPSDIDPLIFKFLSTINTIPFSFILIFFNIFEILIGT